MSDEIIHVTSYRKTPIDTDDTPDDPNYENPVATLIPDSTNLVMNKVHRRELCGIRFFYKSENLVKHLYWRQKNPPPEK